MEELEEEVRAAEGHLESERSTLADDQNTVNVLRDKALSVDQELEFVDAEVAAKQTAVTASLSQLQLKESLLADKDTIIAQLSKQVRQVRFCPFPLAGVLIHVLILLCCCEHHLEIFIGLPEVMAAVAAGGR